MPSADTPASVVVGRDPVTFAQALRVWSRIGWLGFGGPAGQIALMHRELVERRRWISEPRFLHALNYCMLLPGPEAQQLAIYVGWLLHRTRGGIAAGVLFVLPGVLVLGVLSALYVAFGELPIVTAIFFGLKAAVLAIVFEAVLRIGRRALKSRFAIVLAMAAFISIFALRIPFPVIVAGAALAGMLAHRFRPAWMPQQRGDQIQDQDDYLIDRMLVTGAGAHTQPSAPRALRTAALYLALWFLPVLGAAVLLGSGHVVTREGVFFSQTAVVTFGGAYAVLAYVAQRAVEQFGWLHPNEMIDGLALAETTPGPLIMVLQFVGFVAAFRHPGGLDPWTAAVLGAAITTWVTFVPCFLFIFVGAPFVEALRRQETLHAALSAITAAVVGVVLNLSVWFALHTLFAAVHPWHFGPLHLDVPDWTTLEPGALVLAVAAFVATLRFGVGLGWTLLGSALLGAGYWALRHGVSMS